MLYPALGTCENRLWHQEDTCKLNSLIQSAVNCILYKYTNLQGALYK